jgi:hypothetical protein
LTIIGESAATVENACEELLSRRVEKHPDSHGTDDWSESDHRDTEALCRRLITVARDLPVVYYAQYLDAWENETRFSRVGWPDQRYRHVWGSPFSLAFYPSKHGEALMSEIKRRRRTKLWRTESEVRWYLEHLHEAIRSAMWLKERFVVVAVNELLGASRYDEEIKAALHLPLRGGGTDDSGTANVVK